jgi:TonB-linked SusC/RagA family outer membrane protein
MDFSMFRRLCITLIVSAMPIVSFAQNITVSGNVKDTSGEPLIGVSAVQDGTLNGVITDENGNYSLSVPANASIVFSIIGFKSQTVAVANRNVIDIVLEEDNELLEESVVVGYGIIKKSDVSGSVASVDQEEMLKRTPVNIESGLQGMAAGVMVTRNSGAPDGSASVRIRGVATVTGSADPLYVVDGVVIGTNSSFLNPSDVESIEILKDASATAIYGSRGANGVILITTKKGSRDNPFLEFSTRVGIQVPGKKPEVGNAQDYAYAMNIAHANDGTTFTNLAYSPEYASKLNTIDWIDAMTRNAVTQSYTLTASGGSSKSSSSASVGYTNNEGIVIRSKFTRLNARANVTHKIKDFIEMGVNINFSHSESLGNDRNLRSWAVLIPTMDWYDRNTGTFYQFPTYLQNADGTWPTYMQTSGEGDVAKGSDNPYAAIMEQDDTPTKHNRVLSTATLNISFFEGLDFHSIASYCLSTIDASEFKIRNYRVLHADVNPRDNYFEMDQSQTNNLELENYLSFNKRFGIHNLQLMAGNSVSRQWGRSVNARAMDFASETYRQLGMSSDLNRTTATGGYNIESRYISFYGRAIYTLKDRYVFTGSIRRDGSSNFGKGNRWGTFPSAAIAWRLSEEDFIKDLGIFDNLKLRLGWGQTGNAGNATTNAVEQLTSSRVTFTYGKQDGSLLLGSDNERFTGYQRSKEIDTNLKWETNEQTNIGLDVSVLKNSLNLTLDYFIRDSKDLLLNRQLRASSGFTQVYTTVGEIRNTGFEFSLNFKKEFGDFFVNATLNGSTLKNRVVNVGDPIYSSPSYDAGRDEWSTASITQNGYAVGSYYGYVVEGIFQSQAEVAAANAAAAQATNGQVKAYQLDRTSAGDFKYKDIDGNGYINAADRAVLGNGFPKLNYGINLVLEYKAFDATIYGYGVAGMTIFSHSSMRFTSIFLSAGGTQNTLKEYQYGAWSPENPDAIYPKLTIVDNNQNRKASSAYLQKGDFFKMANIQLGYSLPSNTAKKIGMTRARVYMSLENIACFSSYNKWGDPEVGNVNILATGFDGGRYPYPRSCSFGVNLTF